LDYKISTLLFESFSNVKIAIAMQGFENFRGGDICPPWLRAWLGSSGVLNIIAILHFGDQRLQKL